MTNSGVFQLALTALCFCLASSIREVRTEAGISPCEGDRTICVVSTNQPFAHEGGIPELMQRCIDSNKETSIVLLAMQDYGGENLPHYIKNFKGIDREHRFKLRHTVALPGSEEGKGNFCYSQFAGGVVAGAAAGGALGFKVGLLAHLGGPIVGCSVKAATTIIGAVAGGVVAKLASSTLGVNCGGVAVAVYSLRKVPVDFKMTDPYSAAAEVTATTSTTKKGSVAMRVSINGQKLVLASTHGNEGLRVKKEQDSCPLSAASLAEEQEKFAKGIKNEIKRVEDFKLGLRLIQTLRQNQNAAVIWGGDFNPRSVHIEGSAKGCPVFPGGSTEGDLEDLQRSRDVLGSNEDGNLVTFSELIKEERLKEAAGLVCPTYKKAAPKKTNFSCTEDGQTFHYKASHPPSWTDRIFHSDEAWLSCDSLKRVAHKEDHDAVLLTCVVSPGPDCSSDNKEEDEEEQSRCCCDAQGGKCQVFQQAGLDRSWNPLQWNKAVCPGGLHRWSRYHQEMPASCIDMLDAGVAETANSSSD